MLDMEKYNISSVQEALVFWNPWWSQEKKWLQAYERDSARILKNFIPRKEIITISGVRRSGKTTILYLLIDFLIKDRIPAKNILHLNLEDPVFKDASVYFLYEKYLELMNPSGKVYLFLDEIQEIEGWQKDVRKLYDGVKNIKIVITGSNSSLLKGDYASLLTGRTILHEVYPYSFKEVVKLKGILRDFEKHLVIKGKTKILHLLREYIKYGGFPEAAGEGDEKIRLLLLKEYYTAILTRDVIRRYPIRQTRKYETAAHYLMSNITGLFSVKNLSSLLGINMHTLEEYIGFLEDVYLLFPVNHFSYSLKRQVTYPRKIYCIDNGFIEAVSFRFSQDTGRLLENLVFSEIKRSGKECYYWKGRKECDFIIKEGRSITDVIQVAHTMKGLNTKKREVEGLLEAMKEFNLNEGRIITYDESDTLEVENRKVTVIPVWQWLLGL